MRHFVLRSGVVLALAGLVSACGSQPPLVVQQEVDLQRYVGTWHEQARLPNRFQAQCLGDVRADYALLPDQSISVVNQCRTESGTDKAEAEGRLATSPTPLSPSRLQVRFAPAWLSWLPFVWGDYWIMKIEGDYEYSLVGTPNREYLWVLSRDKNADSEVVQRLLQYAAQQGFDIDKVKLTP